MAALVFSCHKYKILLRISHGREKTRQSQVFFSQIRDGNVFNSNFPDKRIGKQERCKMIV